MSSTDRLPIIDSDRHVIEPIDLWRQYLPPSYKARAPFEDGGHLIFEGRSPFGEIGPAARRLVHRQALERFDDLVAASHPQGQLRAMDRQGVDVAFLFPTYALYLAYVDGLDADLSRAIAEAYNAWLFDYCRAAPDRLKGVGLICRHDPRSMVEQLEQVVDLGWRVVAVRPNPVGGRSLADPAYAPFWAACEEASTTIAFHEGTQARLPTVGADRFKTRFAQHACSHPMEQMMAFLALLEAGVLHRHPRLRVAFLEAGAAWLPPWLWRLDELSWPHMKEEVADTVPLSPSTYFKRQCWISFEGNEPGLEQVIERIGLNRLVYGSDYPHPDHGVAHVTAQIQTNDAALSERLRRAALCDNPRRLFAFDL